jgi:hypothetical protein
MFSDCWPYEQSTIWTRQWIGQETDWPTRTPEARDRLGVDDADDDDAADDIDGWGRGGACEELGLRESKKKK